MRRIQERWPGIPLCLLALGLPNLASAQSEHVVTVDANGQFTPQSLEIEAGDTVRWLFDNRHDSVVRIPEPVGAGVCESERPYDALDPNEFSGPMPVGASGVFVMGPRNLGLVVEQDGCSTDQIDGWPVQVGDQYLCEGGPEQQLMDWTWGSDANSGGFVRLTWSDIDLGPDAAERYNFEALTHELNQAADHGKLLSLVVLAGVHGTPEWVYEQGVQQLSVTHFHGENKVLTMANAVDPAYTTLYNELLTAIADHIKSDARWYRSLAFVKLSGINDETPENKLPRGCVADLAMPCNNEVWATADPPYRPSALLAAYESQALTIAREFPGKSMQYMLIQDGFPLVNDDGDYLGRDALGMEVEVDANGDGVVDVPPLVQTEAVIELLQGLVGDTVVIQHNGLLTGPDPDYVALPAVTVNPVMGHCKYYDSHPVGGPVYDYAGTGCPNRWVLEAGYTTRTLEVDPYVSVTSYQMTSSRSDMDRIAATTEDLEAVFANGYDNSDAVMVEMYEDMAWAAETETDRTLDPAVGRTLGDWDEIFVERRRNEDWARSDSLPDPHPLEHSHRFEVEEATDFYYVHGRLCSEAPVNPSVGQIIVQMPSFTEFDTGEPSTEHDPMRRRDKDSSGCGCRSASGAGMTWWGALMLAAFRRRGVHE